MTVFEWQQAVLDKDLTAPPGGESKGDRYIVATGGSGDWAGQDGNIATYNGSGWDFTTKSEGMFVYIKDEDKLYYYVTSWSEFIGSGDITSVGDVTSGAAFDGTQGTTLTFYNVGGNATLDYDGTDFTLSKPINMSQNITTSTTVTGEQLTSTDDITMAGLLTNTLSAADTNGMVMDGVTNPYTSAGDAIQGYTFLRTWSQAADSATHGMSGMYEYFTNTHVTSGAMGGIMLKTSSNVGVQGGLVVNGAHSCTTPAQGFVENNYGTTFTVTRSGTLTITGNITLNDVGNYSLIQDTTTINNAGGTLNANLYGYYSQISQTGSQTAGTFNKTAYGYFATMGGNSSGTTVGYGYYLSAITGFDTLWGFYNNSTAGHNFLGKDNLKTYFGTGQDASIYYDATNLVIKPDDVGTGYLHLSTSQAVAMVIGNGAAGIDYILRFNGETNDGDIKWMEDEDQFTMNCSLAVNNTGNYVATIGDETNKRAGLFLSNPLNGQGVLVGGENYPLEIWVNGTSNYFFPAGIGTDGQILKLNGATSALEWTDVGAGTITTVGDVTTGNAAFDGTQGTTLTFYNVGGNATEDYDGTDFSFSKPVQAGSTYTATIGDDANTRSYYGTDGSFTITNLNYLNGLLAPVAAGFTYGGGINEVKVELGGSGKGGYFENQNGGSYITKVSIATDNAINAVDGTNTIIIGSGTNGIAGQDLSGNQFGFLVPGYGAGVVTDGTNLIILGDITNAINSTGNVKMQGLLSGVGPPATILTNFNLYVDNLTGIVYVD